MWCRPLDRNPARSILHIPDEANFRVGKAERSKNSGPWGRTDDAKPCQRPRLALLACSSSKTMLLAWIRRSYQLFIV